MAELKASTVAESTEISNVWKGAMEAITGPTAIFAGTLVGVGGGTAAGSGGYGGSAGAGNSTVPSWATQASGQTPANSGRGYNGSGATIVVFGSTREGAQWIGNMLNLHAQNGGTIPPSTHPAPVTPGISR
jgi:hypothetical protein